MANKAPVDEWTPVHVLAGVGASLVGLSPLATGAAGIAYEIGEQVLERTELGHRVFGTKGPESLVNVAADLAAMAVGYGLGELAKKASR